MRLSALCMYANQKGAEQSLAAQPGLCQTWSEMPKIGSLAALPSTSLNVFTTEETGTRFSHPLFEPRCEKSALRGFRPGPTQTALYSHRRRWLEA